MSTFSSSTMNSFPKSFQELFKIAEHELNWRTIWDPLEGYFESQGLTLWVISGSMSTMPPDSRPRAPDGFHYRSQGAVDWNHPFLRESPTLCPARTTDGRDVVIRLVAIGDEGVQQKLALERLATGNIASVIGNHAAPVLRWLHLDNLTFAVFPHLSILDPTPIYLYENLYDIMGHLLQMLEAVAFAHSKLVAHRDLFSGNFLCNFIGGPDFDTTSHPWYPDENRVIQPFRSLFPFTIYLIDFEMAVCFDPDSSPATHLASEIPELGREEYLRPVAPELTTNKAYNPFLLDVWQLGTYFAELADANVMPASVLNLIQRMTASAPAERPTSAECLAEWRSIMSSLAKAERLASVQKPRAGAQRF